MKRMFWLFAAVVALTACGGGSPAEPGPQPAPAPAPSPAPAPAAPGGLYVGYYAEDPATNPEDPTLGAFTLHLPAGNAGFSGSMYFTYVGCQTSNVGTVSGTKTDLSLSGTWAGTVDGSPQSGPYSGSFNTATQSYAGVYSNAGGKQYRDLRPCIEYHIAPNGTWEMFAVETSVPASFTVGVSGRTVSWSGIPNAELTLVYVLDPIVAQGAGNPVVWQGIEAGAVTAMQIPPGVALQSGREYIAAVGIADATGQRAAFGSVRFVAP